MEMGNKVSSQRCFGGRLTGRVLTPKKGRKSLPRVDNSKIQLLLKEFGTKSEKKIVFRHNTPSIPVSETPDW